MERSHCCAERAGVLSGRAAALCSWAVPIICNLNNQCVSQIGSDQCFASSTDLAGHRSPSFVFLQFLTHADGDEDSVLFCASASEARM